MQTVRNPVFLVFGDEPKHEQASSRGFVSGAIVDRVDGIVLRIAACVAHPGESDGFHQRLRCQEASPEVFPPSRTTRPTHRTQHSRDSHI